MCGLSATTTQTTQHLGFNSDHRCDAADAAMTVIPERIMMTKNHANGACLCVGASSGVCECVLLDLRVNV